MKNGHFEKSSILNFFLQKNIFFGKKSKWPIKKTEIFKIINSQNFFAKISQIGPWVELNDAKGIDVAQPIWP